jgi:two-component system phosphate regulon response regulator PhoB
MGADDYITKPFSVRELIARVRALFRRLEMAEIQRPVVRHNGMVIDARAHRVTVAEQPVELSALEFRLLLFMASHPGIVFSRDQLLDRVWGGDRNVTPRSVDVYVRRLREKISAASGESEWLQTVHGVGYRFMDAEP